MSTEDVSEPPGSCRRSLVTVPSSLGRGSADALSRKGAGLHERKPGSGELQQVRGLVLPGLRRPPFPLRSQKGPCCCLKPPDAAVEELSEDAPADGGSAPPARGPDGVLPAAAVHAAGTLHPPRGVTVEQD